MPDTIVPVGGHLCPILGVSNESNVIAIPAFAGTGP